MARLSLPHLLLDRDSKALSCASVAEVAKESFREITNSKGEAIGRVLCRASDFESIRTHFAEESADFPLLKASRQRHAENLFKKDMETVLFLSAQGGHRFDELLYRCCLSLRSHAGAENCSVFGLPDGTSLQGLMAVTQDGKKDSGSEWNYSSMNLATIAIQEKAPYVCADPSVDPNFKRADGTKLPRNLISFPIVNAGEAIGLVNLSNKINGIFNEADLTCLRTFATVASHLIREEFEKRKSEKFQNESSNLSRYLSANVVRKISATGTTGSLGGETKKVVTLFSDIRSFSSITEGISAPVLVDLLNFYFDEMSAVIDKYDGTLDKLAGDMMMVLWNTPHEQPDPEVLAVKAAIEMQRACIKKVAPKWREHGVDRFGIGIGINAGEAVVGNLGSQRFMNYTVIGNSINTAQRLEAKARAGEIWVHESLSDAIHGKVPQHTRIERAVKLKGLSDAINAWVFVPTL